MSSPDLHPDETQQHELLVAGTLAELAAKGWLLVKGPSGTICVVNSEGGIFAVDDVCPHMGSDLHRGEIFEGRLVCPWHRARFDLATGQSLDLYAADIHSYDVTIRDGDVLVDPIPRTAPGDSPR
jgi:nitrite reductase/ring-hydroxylating ferredoxin subunit